MSIIEFRKDPHLSASSIKDYIDCGMLYKLSRIDKLKPEFRSDNLEFGSTIHRVLREYYLEKLNGYKLPLEELLELFELYWRSAAEDQTDIRYSEGKDFLVLLSEGKALLTAFYESLPDNNFKVLAIEEPFKFTINSLPIPLIGILDLVEEDADGIVIITDWKTTSRAYSKTEIDANLQMTLYHLAVKSNGYHDREIILRLDCLIKTKKARFDQYYTARSIIDENRLIKKIRMVWEGISKEIFIPNDTSWRCQNCAYKCYCDEWFADE